LQGSESFRAVPHLKGNRGTARLGFQLPILPPSSLVITMQDERGRPPATAPEGLQVLGMRGNHRLNRTGVKFDTSPKGRKR